ncbi:MAG: hypothetical protein QXN05_03470 [Acidilobaceae archaeon]
MSRDMRRVLLLLPCNQCVRLGDYSLCDGWKIVKAYVGDLVSAGLVNLGAVDSCKPGVVLHGDELKYSWCDIAPYWDKVYSKDLERLEVLIEALAKDLKELSLRYTAIATYINVKAYRIAVLEASKRSNVSITDLSPSLMSPLSFRSKKNLEKLRRALLELTYLHSFA